MFRLLVILIPQSKQGDGEWLNRWLLIFLNRARLNKPVFLKYDAEGSIESYVTTVVRICVLLLDIRMGRGVDVDDETSEGETRGRQIAKTGNGAVGFSLKKER